MTQPNHDPGDEHVERADPRDAFTLSTERAEQLAKMVHGWNSENERRKRCDAYDLCPAHPAARMIFVHGHDQCEECGWVRPCCQP